MNSCRLILKREKEKEEEEDAAKKNLFINIFLRVVYSFTLTIHPI